MKTCKYLIIGAGLGGHQAAAGIRKLDKQGEVLLVGQEPRRPYHRPPLTKEYMQGKKPMEKAFCEGADFYAANGIELLTSRSVSQLDAAGKLARLDNDLEVRFQKCIYATGGRPVQLDIPGADHPGVFYFRTMDDASAVSAAANSASGVAVVGGGFIGMELASSLTQRGRQVHIIDSGPYVWRRFADRQLSEYAMNYCAARGVKFHTGQRAEEVRLSGGKTVGLATSTGEQIDADLVIIAAGIVPNVELARQAGLACENGVMVNDRMQSSHADIYAVGDVANYPDPFFNKRRRVEHWGQADYTGDLAGRNAAGAQEPYNLLSYIWSDIFDLHLEFAGMEFDYDRLLVRGQIEENRFALLHLKQDHLTAYYSVNLAKAEYQAMGKLIEKQVDLSGRETELANPAFTLEELAAAPAAR